MEVNLKLYLKYISIHIKSQMQYKVSLIFMTLGQFLVSFTAFLGLLFIFINFREVNDFTFPQVLLCFSIVLLASSLAEAFGRGFDLFPNMIGNGEFDRMLVRPRWEVFLVVASKMEISRAGRLLQAILVLIYALLRSGIEWTGGKIVTLFLMITCGGILFFLLFLLRAGISFFTIEGLEFTNIFVDGTREFGRYPFSVYGKEVLWFLTFIIPIALIQYYPLLYLLDMERGIAYMLTPLISLLFIFPAYGFWRFGLRRYKSTGS